MLRNSTQGGGAAKARDKSKFCAQNESPLQGGIKKNPHGGLRRGVVFSFAGGETILYPQPSCYATQQHRGEGAAKKKNFFLIPP